MAAQMAVIPKVHQKQGVTGVIQAVHAERHQSYRSSAGFASGQQRTIGIQRALSEKILIVSSGFRAAGVIEI
jgi:ABC-type oligopeptide transport system ATPase subunit